MPSRELFLATSISSAERSFDFQLMLLINQNVHVNARVPAGFDSVGVGAFVLFSFSVLLIPSSPCPLCVSGHVRDLAPGESTFSYQPDSHRLRLVPRVIYFRIHFIMCF